MKCLGCAQRNRLLEAVSSKQRGQLEAGLVHLGCYQSSASVDSIPGTMQAGTDGHAGQGGLDVEDRLAKRHQVVVAEAELACAQESPDKAATEGFFANLMQDAEDSK